MLKPCQVFSGAIVNLFQSLGPEIEKAISEKEFLDLGTDSHHNRSVGQINQVHTNGRNDSGTEGLCGKDILQYEEQS